MHASHKSGGRTTWGKKETSKRRQTWGKWIKKQNDIYQENAQRNSLPYKLAKTLVRTLKIQPKKYNIMRPKCNYRTV